MGPPLSKWLARRRRLTWGPGALTRRGAQRPAALADVSPPPRRRPLPGRRADDRTIPIGASFLLDALIRGHILADLWSHRLDLPIQFLSAAGSSPADDRRDRRVPDLGAAERGVAAEDPAP